MTSPTRAGALPDPQDRELDDLITSHLDGGLDAAGQRRLAALLAAKPEARATLARYLRLESALVRLTRTTSLADRGRSPPERVPRPNTSGLQGSRAAAPRSRDTGAAPAVRPAWQSRRAAVALAGGAVAAAVALLLIGPPEPPTGRSADIAAVAEQWLDLRAADVASAAATTPAATERIAAENDVAAAAPEELEPDWAEDDVAEPSRGSPPSWLVAAMADDEKV